MPELTIDVDGMVCPSCEKTVCSAVAALDCVDSVRADADTGCVTVECDPADRATVCQCIDGLGFDVPAASN